MARNIADSNPTPSSLYTSPTMPRASASFIPSCQSASSLGDLPSTFCWMPSFSSRFSSHTGMTSTRRSFTCSPAHWPTLLTSTLSITMDRPASSSAVTKISGLQKRKARVWTTSSIDTWPISSMRKELQGCRCMITAKGSARSATWRLKKKAYPLSMPWNWREPLALARWSSRSQH